MSDDPVTDLLRQAKIPDAAKAGLWDLYHNAKNEDDLAGRLRALQLSDSLKADLWDLKAKSGGFGSRADGTQKGGGFFGTLQRPDGRVSTELSIGVDFDGKETQIPLLVPSLSKQEVASLLELGDKDPIPNAIADKAVAYARQRMAAGKPVFAEPGEVGKFKPLPFSFDPNRQRKDAALMGFGRGSQSAEPDVLSIDPEVGAIVGNAVVGPGLTAAGRIAAGAKATAGVAGPLVKYHAVTQTLLALGAPKWFAESAGAVVAARSGAARASEAVAAEAKPFSIPQGDKAAEKSLDVTRRLAAESQAASGKTRQELLREFADSFNPRKVASEVPRAAEKLKYTLQEWKAGEELVKQGFTKAQVENAIQSWRAMQKFNRSFGLPDEATVEDIVKLANETGRMVR